MEARTHQDPGLTPERLDWLEEMLMTIRDDLLAIHNEIRGYRVTLEAGQTGAPPDHRLKRAAA